MDLAEFEDLVDRLGEDISAWPEPARTDARSLLAQSQEAREVLAAAHDMRVGLGRDQTVRAPAGLVDRIMHQAHLESPRFSHSGSPIWSWRCGLQFYCRCVS